VADTIRFDAGTGGNAHLTKPAPDLSGDCTIYVSLRVADLPGEFSEKGLWSLGNSIRLLTYFTAVVMQTDTGGEFTYFDTSAVDWVHIAIVKASGVVTFKMLEQGFDPGAPSYLFNGTIAPTLPPSPALVYFNAADVFGSPGQTNDGTNRFGHYLEYEGVAHNSAQVLAQMQSREAIHTGVTTEWLFDATGVAGASVGQDQSGNGNHATRYFADGFVAEADEPSDWLGPPPPDDVIVTIDASAETDVETSNVDAYISPLTLPANTWVQIQAPPATGVYTQGACLDPTNPLRHFVCWSHAITVVPEGGIWKTENGGLSYRQMSGSLIGGPVHPVDICMPDPTNPDILFVADGVWGGPTQGCWRSLDGGETWEIPGDFETVTPSGDGYHVAANPTDPLHIIFSSHGKWPPGNTMTPGIVETLDGGETWTARVCTGVTSDGGVNIDFLNGSVLLYHSQETGIWRSPDLGTTWSLVDSGAMDHGGGQIAITADAIYISGAPGIRRSTDLGLTWTDAGPTAPITYFMSCGTDGEYIYTGWHGTHKVQRAALPVTDPDSWEDVGTQEFAGPSFRILHEPTTGLLYNFAADDGVWVYSAQAVELAAGVAAEGDTALARALSKTRAMGLATESGTALARALSKSRTVGVALEVDTALARTLSKSAVVGAAVGSNTALARTLSKSLVVGLASGAQTALATAISKALVTGLALEADSSFARNFVGAGLSVTLAAELSAALALPLSKRLALGLGSSAHTALGVTLSRSLPTGIALGADSALARTFTKHLVTARADELSTAFSLLDTTKYVPAGLALEVETALAVAFTKVLTASLAGEGSLAFGGPFSKRLTATQAAELDAVLPLGFGRSYAVGAADELEAAFGLTFTKALAARIAAEVSLALAPALNSAGVFILPPRALERPLWSAAPDLPVWLDLMPKANWNG
jgi:hypothetical protein